MKTKSTKKKNFRGRGDDDVSDDDDVPAPKSRSQEIDFLSVEEIQTHLTDKVKGLKDCPEEMIEALAQQLHRSVYIPPTTYEIQIESDWVGYNIV